MGIGKMIEDKDKGRWIIITIQFIQEIGWKGNNREEVDLFFQIMIGMKANGSQVRCMDEEYTGNPMVQENKDFGSMENWFRNLLWLKVSGVISKLF